MDLAKNLKIDSVSRLQPGPPYRVGPQQTVAQAVDLMRQQQVGSLLVCAGCVVYYTTIGRSAFNPFLHVVLPIGGIVLFFFPLYYQFYKVPPTYPIKYANWVAIAWAALGVVLTFVVVRFAPERLRDVDRVYVEDETVAAMPPVVEPA